MQARAVETTQKALANEAARIGSLLDGGFVSPNEVEQKQAESAEQGRAAPRPQGPADGQRLSRWPTACCAPLRRRGVRPARWTPARSRSPAARSSPSSIAAPCASPPTCPRTTSPTSRPARRCGVTMLATGQKLAVKVVPARSGGRPEHAHRALRGRHPQPRSRHPGGHHRRAVRRRRRAGARDGDPAERGGRARQQGDRLPGRRGRGAREGVRCSASARGSSSSIPRSRRARWWSPRAGPRWRTATRCRRSWWRTPSRAAPAREGSIQPEAKR